MPFFKITLMKKYIFACALALACVPTIAAEVKTDAVLMTVDGRDVTVDEFEYLYKKNAAQQIQKQSIDDYLQLFINYKLKVADAEHAGIPELPEIQQEYIKYRNDLAAPYLRSQAVEDSLVSEAYSHRADDVTVSHIMFENKPGAEQLADSVRNAILGGTISYEDAARRYSADKYSAQRGGLMGVVLPDRYPWPFEKASYDAAVGEITPVVNSGFGYHIIRVESRKPASGEVLASHILRLTRGKSPEEKKRQRQIIDSLYSVLRTGNADFAAMARQYSEDPGSAKNGGSLSWFGRGMMVQPFDSISFALADGAVSEPFETSFGYHIILRQSHRGVPPLDEVRKNILQAMQRDSRANMPADAKLAEFMKTYKASVDDAGLARAVEMAGPGGVDSAFVAANSASKLVVASSKDGKITLGAVLSYLADKPTEGDAASVLRGAAEALLGEAVLGLAREDLAATNADYRNLLNEYREGNILFEIANRNVWDRAAKDKDGLEAYFRANAAKYAWDKPRFKSTIIFATSDSVLKAAEAFAPAISTLDPAEFNTQMRKKFGGNIKIERVIAAQGENPITDYLAFGGKKPDSTTKWKYYTAFGGRVVDNPEDAADVRGAVVADYQNELEKNWIESLHKKYKVKVNNKVFNKLNAEENK